MTHLSRGLDHIVHAVRDLDAAAALYRSLGFTVGARNRHPWGTHNYIVQLPGFFIELLTLAEPDKLGADGFSRLFGAFNGDFIERHEGLSILILQSDDARTDEAAFRAAAIAASETMNFAREGRRPDGTTVKLGFALAFADAKTPDIHFAVCQQHYPENFWNPAFQKHANSVCAIGGTVAVANEPADLRPFLQAFTGAKASDNEGGFTVATPRGSIEVMAPAAFTRAFGVAAPDLSQGPRLAALRFAVSDMSRLQGLPEEAGIAGLETGKPVVIGAQDAMGAVLVFEPKA